MPTYNHAVFVEQAIQSVLMQQHVSFELLIGDDGSSDGTVEAVNRVCDSRINFITHAFNQGACVVVNDLISRSRGDYIALINSDDVWSTPLKLAEQVQLLDAQPELGAVFGKPNFIDRSGNPVAKEEVPFGPVFDQGNRDQAAWLRFFFEHGNCLCHPTMMIRRSCYEEVGLYNNRFRQLPDFDMWMRLVKRFPIHVSEEKWVNFRVLPGENASSPTVLNCIRDVNEHLLIAETCLADVPADMLFNAFSDWLPQIMPTDQASIEVARAIPFIKLEGGPFRRAYNIIGLLKLRHLLDDDECRAILHAHFSLNDGRYHEMLAREDVLTVDSEWSPHSQMTYSRMLVELQRANAQMQDRVRQLERENERPILSMLVRRLKRKIRG